MTFFVDANAILYSLFPGPGREAGLRLLAAVAAGEAQGRTSPAVLEEVWHVARRRRPEQVVELLESLLQVFSPLLPVTEKDFVAALSIEGSSLDPLDRLHLGTCATHGIGMVLTADRAFDAVSAVERIDPLDPAAVDRLLARS